MIWIVCLVLLALQFHASSALSRVICFPPYFSELCRSLNFAEETTLELADSVGHRKPPKKERKKLSTSYISILFFLFLSVFLRFKIWYWTSNPILNSWFSFINMFGLFKYRGLVRRGRITYIDSYFWRLSFAYHFKKTFFTGSLI